MWITRTRSRIGDVVRGVEVTGRTTGVWKKERRSMGRRLPSRRAGISARVFAATLALALVMFRPAFSAPGDIFDVSAPLPGQAPQAAAPIAEGDASVATQTGGLSFGYPISAPPGRGNARPALSLSYSSQAPHYGTNVGAAGWSLSGVPIITQDT